MVWSRRCGEGTRTRVSTLGSSPRKSSGFRCVKAARWAAGWQGTWAPGRGRGLWHQERSPSTLTYSQRDGQAVRHRASWGLSPGQVGAVGPGDRPSGPAGWTGDHEVCPRWRVERRGHALQMGLREQRQEGRRVAQRPPAARPPTPLSTSAGPAPAPEGPALRPFPPHLPASPLRPAASPPHTPGTDPWPLPAAGRNLRPDSPRRGRGPRSRATLTRAGVQVLRPWLSPGAARGPRLQLPATEDSPGPAALPGPWLLLTRPRGSSSLRDWEGRSEVWGRHDLC